MYRVIRISVGQMSSAACSHQKLPAIDRWGHQTHMRYSDWHDHRQQSSPECYSQDFEAEHPGGGLDVVLGNLFPTKTIW